MENEKREAELTDPFMGESLKKKKRQIKIILS
jgi:hypothetical protein